MFGFIVHPLDIEDVVRRYKIAKFLPQAWVEFFLKYKRPTVLAEASGIRSVSTGREVSGYFVACPLTSRQLLSEPEWLVLERIISAGKLCERLGAKIVGLGAFTAVVGDAGWSVAKNLGIAVTTGNSYTVAVALEATYKAAELLGIELPESKLAIVGAAGSIGKVCTKMVSENKSPPAELILIDRNRKRLEELAATIKNIKVSAYEQVKPILKEADVVITVASATTPIVEPADLKAGALVCDVARPRNVAKAVAQERAGEVLVIEGGIVEVPGSEFSVGFDFGLPHRQVFACMAETMVLALEGRYENYTIGRNITAEQVYEISRLAAYHGFKLSGFRSFDRVLTDEEVERVRQVRAVGL